MIDPHPPTLPGRLASEISRVTALIVRYEEAGRLADRIGVHVQTLRRYVASRSLKKSRGCWARAKGPIAAKRARGGILSESEVQELRDWSGLA